MINNIITPSEMSKMNIEDMSTSGILTTVALEMMKMYGQHKESWARAAELYRIYKEEVADWMIEETLGDIYMLDREGCEMYLLNAGLAK